MQHKVRYRPSSLIILMISLWAMTSLFCSLGNGADKDSQKKSHEDATTGLKNETASTQKQDSSNQVTVYVTSWCPVCKMTIDFLKKEGIPHTVKDIEKNPAYLDEMVKKAGGNRGVPVVDVNGKILLGFNPYIIKEMLH